MYLNIGAIEVVIAGGCDAIVNAMKNFPERPQAQLQATTALWCASRIKTYKKDSYHYAMAAQCAFKKHVLLGSEALNRDQRRSIAAHKRTASAVCLACGCECVWCPYRGCSCCGDDVGLVLKINVVHSVELDFVRRVILCSRSVVAAMSAHTADAEVQVRAFTWHG